MQSFTSDLRRGQGGEAVVANYFESQNYYVSGVTSPQLQRTHGDFYVSGLLGQGEFWIEVKNEEKAAETGNIAFELMSNVMRSPVTEGWVHHLTDCDFLICVIPQEEILIIFRWKAFKQDLLNWMNRERKENGKSRNYKLVEQHSSADQLNHSIVSLVPRSLLKTISKGNVFFRDYGKGGE